MDLKDAVVLMTVLKPAQAFELVDVQLYSKYVISTVCSSRSVKKKAVKIDLQY